MIQFTAFADNDSHRADFITMMRAQEGCRLVRDLHHPTIKPQLVCAYFDDEPSITNDAMPDGMRRVLVPAHFLAQPSPTQSP